MKQNNQPWCLTGISLVVMLLTIFLFFSCSSTKMVRKPPPFQVIKSILAKDVDKTGSSGAPVDVTDTFTISDQKVVSHVQLKNVSGKHTLKWEWYMPDGRLYYSSKGCDVAPAKGKYFKDTSAWHNIFIDGDKASAFPGTWMVKVYYDGDVISTKNFEIQEMDRNLGAVVINTTPENATVRILNIKPKFFQGMKLGAGEYDVEISAPGYQTQRMWLTVKSGTHNSFDLPLQPAQPAGVNFLSKRNSYAVIIGISRYQFSSTDGLQELAFADDDAEAFRNMLLQLGWSNSHIKTLINENAKRNDILIALESWLTKVGPDDMIVLFWSGHGFPDPEDPEKVYFACYDTNINIPATGYRMDRVREILQERNAKNVIVLADTCHAGKLITRGSKGISVQPYVQKLKREQRIPKGWIYMVGADTDRLAIEHSSWSNGAFTHTLLKALGGEADGFESVSPKDGVVDMRELRAYLESVMPDDTQKVLGTAKRPIITTSSGDPEIWNISLDLK
ncbi:MAG: caspase family protein [Proteobacteria bacterium]|nr:caspase family protein [Pseudomonadota bacterium]